ncbi:unnamed protein product [Sphagnum troendelagicum]|uniref:Uncharacterized protein n=1 Tax=Sphagnum troendelagicum TaxID=128251 RepID=A0ABP0V4N3_9BRYO
MDTEVLPLLNSSHLRFSVSPSHACYCSSYLHPPRRRTEGIHPPLLLLGRIQAGAVLEWDNVPTGNRRRQQQQMVMAVGKSTTQKFIQPVEEMGERQADSEVVSSSPVAIDNNAVMVVQPKKKRGRPKKVQDVLEEQPTASNKASEVTSKGESEEGISMMQSSMLEEEEKNAQGLSEDDAEMEKFLLGGNWTIKIDDSKKGEGDDDDDDDGQPLWVEEDDPTWPAEAHNWVIKEITTNDWEATVFADPSPLVVYLFARYGPRGPDGWNMLNELEKAVETIWESWKAPLRVVKLDMGLKIDLASALEIHIDECPALLLIKNGKGFQRLEGFKSSEELMQIMAHYFYNAAQPSCLDQIPTTKNVKRIKRSVEDVLELARLQSIEDVYTNFSHIGVSAL